MSLKTFFSKIGRALARIWNGLPKYAKTAVHAAVSIVDGIKKFDNDNPQVLNALVKAIPGTIDDVLLLKFRENAVTIAGRVSDAFKDITEPDEVIRVLAQLANTLTGDERKKFLTALAVETTIILSDDKVTWEEAVYMVKWYKDHEYEPVKQAA